MNNPELYLQSNQISKRDSQQVLQDFVESINWHPDGCDSLLDAGCGPGDVTMDIVLPFLPPSFERLVGVDISHEMISYARKTRIHPKLSFEQFNLNIEFEKQSLCNVEPFDHIFSCYVLRMVPNVKMCLENFYKLLKPDGDMLLLFNRCSYNHAIYLELSNNSKWSKYLADEKIYHAPNFDWYGPPEAFRNLLNECGFSKCDIRVYQNTYNESYETVRSMQKKNLPLQQNKCF